jgi:phosphoribosylanthranilate isomerase
VAVDIKFCGLTRAEDARQAVALGASFVGVIFAGGPRTLTVERAAAVLADTPATVRRVGVFGAHSPDEIARTVDALELDIVQLHGPADAARVARVRGVTNAMIWPVLRVRDTLPPEILELVALADGLLLDAFVPGALGGTGVALPWAELAEDVQRARRDVPIVLAGGLGPENVAEAIGLLAPDVVDVSSGVESAPGIKDHERMRAFRDAVARASIGT